ncbi:MAG TPA: flagellin [Candidatus Thermoplasmatota archaeon]|jgi:flagellin FlaB|nr:flagellin [Candidatus Thermoplasmatota archaeon]
MRLKANRTTRARGSADHAEVGIGTLIVFIATILVAAVAASVLINTSNSLQEKAQRTGSEATQQVATNLEVVRVIGSNDGAGGDLDTLRVLIGLAAGAKQVDLSQAIVRMSDGATEVKLAYAAAASATEFEAAAIRDEDASYSAASPVMTPGDLVEITVDLTAAAMELPPRNNVEFSLMPEVGAPISADFRTPATYGTDTVFTLR